MCRRSHCLLILCQVVIAFFTCLGECLAQIHNWLLFIRHLTFTQWLDTFTSGFFSSLLCRPCRFHRTLGTCKRLCGIALCLRTRCRGLRSRLLLLLYRTLNTFQCILLNSLGLCWGNLFVFFGFARFTCGLLLCGLCRLCVSLCIGRSLTCQDGVLVILHPIVLTCFYLFFLLLLLFIMITFLYKFCLDISVCHGQWRRCIVYCYCFC